MTEKRKPHVHASTRRRARECATQFLFGLEFTRYDWQEALDDFWAMVQARPTVKAYAEFLIKGVLTHVEALDAEVTACLNNWAPTRMGHVERSVIRIALFEIRHCKDVPRKTAINEAIEIAKLFGADDAPRFVNGVLDAITRE